MEAVPVHKGGSFDEASNFRPVSVVSVVAKILEKIVSSQLSSYLENHNLLHHHQGTYRHGKSAEDILLVAVDSIIHHLDKGEPVWHSILLTTLFC